MSNGRVILITGAGGGIGNAIALKFGKEGNKVVLWDLFISEEFIKTLETEKISFLFDKIDITKKQDIVNGTKKVIEKWGRIDVLVNNAGVTKDKIVFKMEEEDWDYVINVNLKGAFLCSKIIGRIMFSQKEGSIINIASIIGEIGNVGQANYSASKGGLIALTKTCAKEFARAGINVNAIAPGYIKTKMTEHLPEEVKKDMITKIPLNRFGFPEEVAELVFFLSSEKAKYITGQVIRIDGGLVM